MESSSVNAVEMTVGTKRKNLILSVVLVVGAILFYVAFAYIGVYGTDTPAPTPPPTATGGTEADELWNTIAGFIGTWVFRLGGVVLFVGGIMFGLGWKSDDAEGKSRGISTMIAGAIVMGLAGMVDTFFGT